MSSHAQSGGPCGTIVQPRKYLQLGMDDTLWPSRLLEVVIGIPAEALPRKPLHYARIRFVLRVDLAFLFFFGFTRSRLLCSSFIFPLISCFRFCASKKTSSRSLS